MRIVSRVAGSFDRHSLHVLGAATLAVTAAESEVHAWLARLSADTLAFEGTATAPGLLIDEPVMGPFAPVAAIAVEGAGLSYVELAPHRFVDEGPCAGL